MRISLAQYLAHEAKLSSRKLRSDKPIFVRESDIHDDIINYCKSKGWYYVHSHTWCATTNAPGTPDFVIAADNGKTYWIECKRPGGKATTPQLAALTQLQKFGHVSAIVTSLDEFLSVVSSKNSSV